LVDTKEIRRRIDITDQRLRMYDAMEMADIRAQREDYNYDPDGIGANKLFDAKMKMHATRNQLIKELAAAENKLNG
jgi:hypothetical protein